MSSFATHYSYLISDYCSNIIYQTLHRLSTLLVSTTKYSRSPSDTASPLFYYWDPQVGFKVADFSQIFFKLEPFLLWAVLLGKKDAFRFRWVSYNEWWQMSRLFKAPAFLSVSPHPQNETMVDDLAFPDSVKDFVFDLHDASRRSFIPGEQLGLYQTIFREITAKVRRSNTTKVYL